MTISLAQTASLTCPVCGVAFDADVWLIVAADKRPDLVAQIRAGTLHTVVCPNGHASQIDAPLLLYRPQADPPILFSPAEQTTREQDQQQAEGLIGALRERLGNAWRDAWLAQGLPGVQRAMLPIALADDPEAALHAAQAQMQQALDELRERDPDAAASRDGVLAALDALAARAGEDDTVFVFYASHGEYGDDGYYLTTHDTRLAGRKVAVGTGLREAELIAKLRVIKAKRLLLVVNACHSGEISPVLAPGEEPLTGPPLPPQVSAALLGTGTGRVIISACRENQYSFIGPGLLTLFTQALVDGLQGKGVSSNRGYISVFDLYTHLYFALDEAVPRKVSAAVRQRYGEKQEPKLTILGGVGPFAVALYRGATTLGDFDASSPPP
jgi:hypothetical protein